MVTAEGEQGKAARDAQQELELTEFLRHGR
jgi:hypothetical protein